MPPARRIAVALCGHVARSRRSVTSLSRVVQPVAPFGRVTWSALVFVLVLARLLLYLMVLALVVCAGLGPFVVVLDDVGVGACAGLDLIIVVLDGVGVGGLCLSWPLRRVLDGIGVGVGGLCWS